MPVKKQRLTPDQQDLIRLLGTLFEGSHTVFGLKDRQHRYLYVNNAGARVLGHTAEEITGCRPDKFLMPYSARALRQHQEAVMASRRPARFVEQIGVWDRAITSASVYFPLKNRLGMVTSVGFIGVNISDRGWPDDELQHMLKEAQDTIQQLQQRVEEMRVQATTDPLTGVLNRFQAEVIARQEIARQARNSTESSVICMGLDGFKPVTDTWGQTAGDAVLVEFTRVVQGCLRTSDVLARWGGEAFVIILPDTGLESASQVAERIRHEIGTHHFTKIGSLTASFGIAAYMPGETWQEWLERADAALYRAKSNGRNRIELDRLLMGDAVPADVAYSSGFLRLAWRRHYESGHPVVDQQHRQLFVLANNLLSALLAAKPKEYITLLIDGLITAVREHFRDEEAIIREAGFPDADEHARIHDRIVRKARRLSKRYRDDKLDPGDLFSFLAYDVVAMHMLVDDRKFFECLNQAPSAASTSSALGEPPDLPAEPVAIRTGKSTVSAAKTKAVKLPRTTPQSEKAPRKRAKKASLP